MTVGNPGPYPTDLLQEQELVVVVIASKLWNKGSVLSVGWFASDLNASLSLLVSLRSLLWLVKAVCRGGFMPQ